MGIELGNVPYIPAEFASEANQLFDQVKIRQSMIGLETIRKNKNGVTDQGCGISKEVLSKLGEPFYTTKEKGTGLGFMVSKKIIENHSGKITVKSELDKGTGIEIRLPICDS